MKKIILYFATGLTLLVSQACKKNNTDAASAVNETVAVNLSANQTYKYTLPASANTESYTVKTSGVNSATSAITSDANGSTFMYTPSQNFSGADQVVISNQPAQAHPCTGQCHHNGCGHKPAKGNCDGGAKQIHTITFNIAVAKQSD